LEATTTSTTQRGGRYITASGSLNVLFVYIQFPDDNYLPNNTYWPKGQAPAYMDATIDSVWSSTPTQGSFTDYFNQMSFNTFKITGKSISAITPHSRNWYLNNNWKRGDIQKEVIQSLDVTIDFAQFDHWRFNSEYSQTDTADGVVDMIIMMWRNVCNDTVDVRSRLDLIPGGEASLGYYDRNYNTSFTVDNGARTIQMGYSGYGSGITAIHPRFGDLNRDLLWRYARHEFGHWLLGGNEYHTKLGTWGLLDGWGAPSGCMNSYERYKLGWMNFNTIDDITTTRTIFNNTMPDFITADSAYRIKVPGGGTDEYYLLENHQRSSIFDIPDNNVSTATGIFVLLQTYDQGNAVSIVSADGRFDWSVPYQSPNIYGGTGNLPVFLRGTANRINGYSKRQNIPWYWQGIYQGTAPIHYYQNQYGTLVQAPPTIFTGDGKDQFDLNNSTVFSSASNPSSDIHSNTNKIGFEITGYNSTTGIYTVNIHINTTENAAPSKPQDVVATLNLPNQTSLTWTANQETDIVGYNIYRGVVYTGSGEPAYTKINSTLLTTTTYTDNNYESITGLPQNIDLYHRYRITAVDNQNKASVKSEYVDSCFTHIATGTISTNRTYQINVNVIGDVTGQSSATLTILPGTRVMFESGKCLIFNEGKLIANGTSSQPITFTSNSSTPQSGDWVGILCSGGGPDTLTYCDIKYAEYGIYFANTQPNSYMNNVKVSYSHNYGVGVSSTGTANTALKVYSCTFLNNREEGLLVSNAKVLVTKSHIDSNGISTVSSGVSVGSAGKVYFDSTYIQNNGGSGIDVSGSGSRVSLSTDEIQRGYNTVSQHSVSELYVHNSATALLGYTEAVPYCDCIQNDSRAGLSLPDSEMIALTPSCPAGCEERYHYYPRAGWNNVTNLYTYSCRLINNTTSTQISARYNYWGTGSNMFCGSVDASNPQGGPVSKQYMTTGDEIRENPVTSTNNLTDFVNWLKRLKMVIENDKGNAIDALHQLALYVGPGGNYSSSIDVPWEFFLATIERLSKSENVKRLATVMRIQAKLDQGQYQDAIDLSNQVISKTTNDDLWMYCQTRRIFARVGMGDVAGARVIFNSIKTRAESIDAKSVKILQDYLTMSSNISGGGSSPSERLSQGKSMPSSQSVYQNYPNPFNPTTKIKFDLKDNGFVKLTVYDLLSREVKILVNEYRPAGNYDVEFNASKLPSGIYFYKLQTNSFVDVKKMLLVK
jgi:M6 family metalloprotease-like protein